MPLLYCSGTSAVTIWGGKLYWGKRIGHSFDKKIENYKSSLGRENIGYQIDKAEFSKKKFELVNSLYLLISERIKRTEFR